MMALGSAEVFSQNSAWLTGMVLVGLMLGAWAVGWRWGRRLAGTGDTGSAKAMEPSLALMGLLLGFTFAVALQKHEQRRGSIVTDANAIGDFATCVEMLDEPVRGELRGVVREYAEFRVELAREVEADE